MKKTRECPRCHKPTEFSPQNPYRPFCSERCKLIDLGEWADENYTIHEPISPDYESFDGEEDDNPPVE